MRTHRGGLLIWLCVAMASSGVLFLNSAGAQQVIDPGFDLFATAPSPPNPLSFVEIDPGQGPIVIPLEGNPFGPGDTDTIVERRNGTVLPNDGDSGFIEIEMIALSLRSIEPVDVSGSLFDVEIISGSLMGEPANQIGQMQVTRTSPQGGIIDLISLPISFHVTFTNVIDPLIQFDVFGDVDFGACCGAQSPFSMYSVNPGPMDQHNAAWPAGGFYAGIDPISGDKVIWPHVVPGEEHYIQAAMPEPGGALLLLLGLPFLRPLVRLKS